MAKKIPKPEEHVDESWLVPYADILTLLLALFIVLFAMNSTEADKKQMSEAFNIAFNGGTGIMDFPSMTDGNGKRQNVTGSEQKMMKAVSENADLKETKTKVDEKIEELGLEDEVNTSLSGDGLKIVLTDEVLFESGDAAIKLDNINLIDLISKVLEDINNPVEISGYTDNVPINTWKYPSNWELSVARGTSVLSYIIKQNDHLDPIRFSASGYGEYKPIASNDTKEGRQKNRRVEITVKRIYGNGLLVPTNEGGGSDE